MSTKNIGIAIVAILVIGAAGWYAYSHGALMPTSGGTSDTVAVVNGENITRADLTATEAQISAQQGAATTTAAEAALQSQALDSLIGQTLLKQAATQSGIVASSTVVDAQLQAAKAQFSSDDEYQQALSAQGLTEDTLRAQISDSVLVDQYLDQTLNLSAVTASDAEIQTAYDQVASGQTGIPALADVRDQVEQLVIQQKQQTLIAAQVQKLRTAGNVQVLI